MVPKSGGDIIDVSHGAHVDPRLRHRHDDIRKAKTEAFDQHDALVGVDDHFANQIFTGDAEVHGAGCELAGDFGGRQIGNLHAIETADRSAIVAGAARFDERETRARKKRFRVFLQAALGRNGEHQRRGHDAPP